MSTTTPKPIVFPRELIAKYSPDNGNANIQDSPHSLYFRCGPEVSNQIREFLMSRGWLDISYAQMHPIDYPTLLMADIIEDISFQLRKLPTQQRVLMLKSLQNQMNSELKQFVIDNTDKITGQRPIIGNKHPTSPPRTQLYYKAVPAIWNLWWEDQGFNPMNTPLVNATTTWNHIFTTSHVFRKDGLQKELMYLQSIFGDCFKGVIPRGWVLPTEANIWNTYLIELIQMNKDLNVIMIESNGDSTNLNSVPVIENQQITTTSTLSTTITSSTSTNNNTIYISWSQDNMLQCTTYDPRETIPTNLITNESTPQIEQNNENTSPTSSTTISTEPKINNQLPQHIINKHAWIAKPSGGARGEGIFVFNDINKLNDKIRALCKKKSELAASSSSTTPATTSSTTATTPSTSVDKTKLLSMLKKDLPILKNGETTSSTTPTTEAITTTTTSLTKTPQQSRMTPKTTVTPAGKLFTGTLTVQEYINTNMLVGTPQYKFDLRLYVLIVSHFPLEIYIHRLGIVRIASMPYEDDINNTGAHLTNFTVGKQVVAKDKNKNNINKVNDTTTAPSTTHSPNTSQTTPTTSTSTNINTTTKNNNNNTTTNNNNNNTNNHESSATRFDKRYDSLQSDQFDPTTTFSDGLKWTLDEFRSYIDKRKIECDEKNLEMKDFEQIWLEIKHLVLKTLIPTISTQCYGRGGIPTDIYNETIQQQNNVENEFKQKQDNDANNMTTSTVASTTTNNNNKSGTVWEHLFHSTLNENNTTYRGYELLGIDVMLHNDGSPILIEMNRSPAMVVQTPADYAKTQVLHDVFNMLQIEQSMLIAKRNNFIHKQLKDGNNNNNNDDNNQKTKDQTYKININGVDVPFPWRNQPSCFWMKYRPDSQLITNTCPFSTTTLQQYPLVDSDDDDNNDDDANNNTIQGDTNNTSSTSTPKTQQYQSHPLYTEIINEYKQISYKRFEMLNKDVPIKVKRLLKSVNYKKQQQIHHQNDNLLSNDSQMNEPELQSSLTNDESSTQTTSTTSTTTDIEPIVYPFCKPHNFERIYPLNINNYISNYYEYHNIISTTLTTREIELIPQISNFITASMNQLNQQQRQLLEEYQSIQYSLNHIDHLIEYQHLQTFFTNNDDTNTTFLQSFFNIQHPLRKIKISKLYQQLPSLPEPKCIYINPTAPTLLPSKQSSNQQSLQQQHKSLLQNITYMILLTSSHAFHWFQRGFGPQRTIPNGTEQQQQQQQQPSAPSSSMNTDIIFNSLSTLLELPFNSIPIEFENAAFVKQGPLDLRISMAKPFVNQYIFIIIRFLLWYHHQVLDQGNINNNP